VGKSSMNGGFSMAGIQKCYLSFIRPDPLAITIDASGALPFCHLVAAHQAQEKNLLAGRSIKLPS